MTQLGSPITISLDAARNIADRLFACVHELSRIRVDYAHFEHIRQIWCSWEGLSHPIDLATHPDHVVADAWRLERLILPVTQQVVDRHVSGINLHGVSSLLFTRLSVWLAEDATSLLPDKVVDIKSVRLIDLANSDISEARNYSGI